MAKAPAKITPGYLENAALHYLERFASSSANLRRVLMRKVDRSLAHWGGERETAAAQVDSVVAKLAGLGYVDDAAYAAMKVRSLNRQGKGTRMIRAALSAKGVAADHADAALSALAEDLGEPDFDAAIRLARKRRLGPFRPEANRAEMRQKDLAALARAGFDFATARRVIEAASEEELD
ncbi:MAG TPA: regulatory protein RecX [Candidatus Omnitrophota bacterium]|nr:regulatory protein RecX [Candidatus Omnitrophota bacterium]